MFLILFIPLLLTACSGPLSTLDPAGSSAAMVARLWWGMCIGAIAVLLFVVGLWVVAVRRKPEDLDNEQAQRLQTRWIIGGGILLPVVSAGILLTFGIPVGHRMLPLPLENGEALRIEVTGHQWWWEVSYPELPVTNGVLTLTDELHIPVNMPVDVHLTSADVIHSFWVPRLTGKLDLFPGRVNVLRLYSEETGSFRGVCAEFCGLAHAHMQFTLHVHDQGTFDARLEEMRLQQEQEASP